MKLYKQIFFKSKSEKIFVLLVSVVINKQQENARVDRQHNFLGGSALRHNECKEHVVQSFQCVKDLWVLHTTWKPLETLGSELNLETGLCTIIFSWKLPCTHYLNYFFIGQCATLLIHTTLYHHSQLALHSARLITLNPKSSKLFSAMTVQLLIWRLNQTLEIILRMSTPFL